MQNDFINFSGVFGVYDGINLIENGSAGFADKNFGIKNNLEFSYGTASGTKGFTAVAVLSLISENKLKLDDFVKPILKKNDETSEKYGSLEWLSDKLTVRSLLNHTSGIPDYFDEELFDDFEEALRGQPTYRFEKPEDFFPLAESVWKEQKTPYASSGTFKYSNGGFVILAAVVEAVSGMSFPVYVTEKIFKKFGMCKSGFFRLDENPPDGIVRATGYQENGRSNVFGIPVLGGGDGGAFTAVFDMAKFWNQLDPDLNPASSLSPLIEEAWSPALNGDDGFYGLGFWMQKENPRIVFLEGFDPGVQFFSFYNRETKRSITICLNDEKTNCDEVFEKYFHMIE